MTEEDRLEQECSEDGISRNIRDQSQNNSNAFIQIHKTIVNLNN